MDEMHRTILGQKLSKYHKTLCTRILTPLKLSKYYRIFYNLALVSSHIISPFCSYFLSKKISNLNNFMTRKLTY